MLKIGDFSKLSRVSIRMLRHYDEIGLLVPASTDPFTGYRYYSESQLPTAGRIAALREMGFGLAAIADILKQDDDPEVLARYLRLRQLELAGLAEDTARRLRLLETAMERLRKESNMRYNVVLKTLPENGGGRISLAMAIPIAANVGGLGTPIGTPPNAIAIGQLASAGIEVGFGAWMLRMVPVVVVMIIFAWYLLRFLFPFKTEKIEIKIEGEIKKDWNFWAVTVTFLGTILLWMTGELTHLNSNVVALIPFAVFAVLGIFKHEDFAKIDWHVLWMVAGGFALGTALNKTGLAEAMVDSIPFGEWSAVVVLIIAGLLGWLLSNFIANSSAANLLVPILAVVGAAMPSLDAFGGMTMLLVCVAASTSFAMMFPISTPPNAIACSTGLIKTPDMMKVGLIVGVIGIALSYTVLLLFPF